MDARTRTIFGCSNDISAIDETKEGRSHFYWLLRVPSRSILRILNFDLSWRKRAARSVEQTDEIGWRWKRKGGGERVGSR